MHGNLEPEENVMSNSNQLYDDMEKLNALFEELCWGHDDELIFTHENGRVVIYNKTLEKKVNGSSNRISDRVIAAAGGAAYYKKRSKTMNEKAERINGWAAMLGIIAAIGAYVTTGQLIPGVL